MTFAARRDLSLLHLFGLAACVAVLGHAAAGWVAGALPHAPPALRRARPQAPVRAAPAPEPIAARNVFCSSCAPPAPAGDPPAAGGSPRRTPLPLLLVAINHIARRGRAPSSVTLRHLPTQQVGLFTLGSQVQGATITAILPHRIDLEHDGRREYLDFSPADPGDAVAASPTPAAPPASTPARDPLAEALRHGIRQTGATSYEVDRAALELALGNLAQLARITRVVPELAGARPAGFRVADARAGTPLARLGVATGDLLTSINGLELTSVEQAMSLYLKLKTAGHLALSLQRGGRPLTLGYTIR
jgi:general secretion pathway protein C